MKILILHVGQVNSDVSNSVRDSLSRVFPRSSCETAADSLPVPEEAYNPMRNQYNSSVVLSKIFEYAFRLEADRILGVTDVNLYVPQMNFVFGEAQ